MADWKTCAQSVLWTSVEGRGRLTRRMGQAMIEYAFLMVVLATITVGVVALAGDQLRITFNDIAFDTTHISDPNLVTANPHTCADGTVAVFRHTRWRCKDE